jgi:predicted ATPase
MRSGNSRTQQRPTISSGRRSRRQGALSWELRAATGLSRLLQCQHRVAEARDVLRSVYDRFTEGFAMSDLREVRTLLEQLA